MLPENLLGSHFYWGYWERKWLESRGGIILEHVFAEWQTTASVNRPKADNSSSPHGCSHLQGIFRRAQPSPRLCNCRLCKFISSTHPICSFDLQAIWSAGILLIGSLFFCLVTLAFWSICTVNEMWHCLVYLDKMYQWMNWFSYWFTAAGNDTSGEEWAALSHPAPSPVERPIPTILRIQRQSRSEQRLRKTRGDPRDSSSYFSDRQG